MNSLSAGKRLLLAESELNRAQLRSVASSAAGLVAGLAAFTAREAARHCCRETVAVADSAPMCRLRVQPLAGVPRAWWSREVGLHPIAGCHTAGVNRSPMTTLEIKGVWNIIKGKQDELVGRIQKRTGETREAVEDAIRKFHD